jgi:hypothetical protein
LGKALNIEDLTKIIDVKFLAQQAFMPIKDLARQDPSAVKRAVFSVFT